MRADAWLTAVVDDITSRGRMTPGTLTSTMGRTGHPVGMFLRTLTADGVRALPRSSATTASLLVSADELAGGEHATIGTAFGWLLRLKLARPPHLEEARIARDWLPPHVQEALWELDSWILGRGRLDEPGDDERAAIVLAWCEQLFRAGPIALGSSPLLRLAAGSGPAALLDLVPDRFITQLSALGQLAAERLDPLFQTTRTQLGVQLGRRPLAADADLLSGPLLLELKCGKGRSRVGGPTFPLGVDLVRQLLGYALLAADELGVETVGVYAARFGLTWTMPAVELIEACCGHRVDLTQVRAEFARLWVPAA